tara:strand:- start:4191 stop:4388 length:198 start_codon:yes stop_codon:yes gene_type:complete
MTLNSDNMQGKLDGLKSEIDELAGHEDADHKDIKELLTKVMEVVEKIQKQVTTVEQNIWGGTTDV